jgi:hypothetical protein
MENEISIKLDSLVKANAELKILITSQSVNEDWINQEHVCSFMGYGYSQMSNILKKGDLEYVKIGRRTFISRKSLKDYLNNNYQRMQVN